MRPISQGAVVAAASVATAGAIANAFYMNKQFYPAMVYLTRSNASLAVLYVESLVIVYLFFQLVRRIFFGDLRASESDHLSERAWHALMETCLAFTVFKDDFSPVFVMQFVVLLFIKSLHWLSDDRVDLMERSPVLTTLFHARILSMSFLLALVDAFFVSHAYFYTYQRGASSQVVFGFEYAIMLTVVLQVVAKYLLHLYDLRSATPWEQKSVWLLYTEAAINGIRVALYIVFISIMAKVNTLPLFSIRPFYLTLRSFHKAFNDIILSRRAIHAMNSRFPVVTAEELAQIDATCIICREEMTAASAPKKLPCSHVFHAHCLRSWFQRQQTCPTCRTDILSPRAHPNVAAAMREAAREAAPPPMQGGAGAPPNLFPFIAHQFAFPVPRQPNDQGAQGGAAGAVPPPVGFPPPPFFPPIPGMGGFPGLLPPPPPFPLPPRPSTAGLSDEELRQLEGTTREAVEARLRVLADIAALLDAAVLQMQQYSSIVPVVSMVPPLVPSSDIPSTSSAPPNTSSAPSAPQPSTSSATATPSTSVGENEQRPENRQGSPPPENDMDGVRQRRLQRLGEL